MNDVSKDAGFRFGLTQWILLPSILCLGLGARSAPAEWRLIGWNDLGMHGMDGTDFSVFSILPPYNTVHAHLLHDGQLVTDDAGVTVTYRAVADPNGSINSRSADGRMRAVAVELE